MTHGKHAQFEVRLGSYIRPGALGGKRRAKGRNRSIEVAYPLETPPSRPVRGRDLDRVGVVAKESIQKAHGPT